MGVSALSHIHSSSTRYIHAAEPVNKPNNTPISGVNMDGLSRQTVALNTNNSHAGHFRLGNRPTFPLTKHGVSLRAELL